MTIHEIIKDIMKNEGVTQTQLAKKVGVTKQAISHFLNGNDVRLSVVVNILSVLGYQYVIQKNRSRK
jgi:transcriptional regulator with XRE-family HTH domain